MTSWEIEEAVFELEEVRLVIRVDAKANFPNDYNYVRASSGATTVNEWLNARVKPVLAGQAVAIVIDGNGKVPHGRTKMSTIRDSYVH